MWEKKQNNEKGNEIGLNWKFMNIIKKSEIALHVQWWVWERREK